MSHRTKKTRQKHKPRKSHPPKPIRKPFYKREYISLIILAIRGAIWMLLLVTHQDLPNILDDLAEGLKKWLQRFWNK